MSRLIHMFTEVHMSFGHDALGDMVQKKIGEIKPGETVVFINRTWTALKLLTHDGIILHLRRPAHKPINPETIRHLPNCLNGNDLNYDKALEIVIRKKLGKAVKDMKQARKEAKA